MPNSPTTSARDKRSGSTPSGRAGYFYNHGGYDYARQFYEEAYRAAVEIVGGEQYILSAVMHADERNRAMSEQLGEDVYHYHLHVVYVPVVEKKVLYAKVKHFFT